MSSAVLPPAAPPPAPFTNRRGWIIAFGVFEILIGCLVLLAMVLMFIATRMAPVTASVQQPDVRFLFIAAGIYGIIGLAFVAVGIGNVQVKRWARLVMLIASWAWLAMGVSVTLVMAFVLPMIMSAARQNQAQAMPENFETIFRGIMFAVSGIFFILLPLIFVLFYSRKNVKATYENAAGTSTPPRKPVPVLITAAWFALSTLSYPLVLASPALPLFGVLLRGWPAIAFAVALEVLAIWLTVNIYRQRALAWKVSIPMVAFGWVSLLVTMGRMGVSGMYRSMGYSDAQTALMVPWMRYILGFSALVALAFLVMLIATRKHYRDAPALT